MKRSGKWVGVLSGILVVLGLLSVASAAPATQPAPVKRVLVNPFDQQGRWYRANLHTHCKASDGDCDLATRIRQYKDNSYQVLVMTDHGKTNKVTGFSTPNFLVLNGAELHPATYINNSDVPFHFVCLNLPENFSVVKDIDAHELLRQVKQAGGEVIYAHPYWSSQYATDHIMGVINDCIGVEVYNGSCIGNANPDSSVIWDELLINGYYVPAVAVDDTHHDNDLFNGWTMIKARELTPKAILDALRQGCCYASSGPEIKDFRIRDGKVIFETSPAVEADFMTIGHKSRACFAKKGETQTRWTIDLPKDIKFIRAQVIDRDGKRAWTNPIVIESDK